MSVSGSKNSSESGKDRIPDKIRHGVSPEESVGPARREWEGTVVDKSVKLTIPSDTALVHDIQDKVLAEVSRCGFTQQSYFAIKLALEEGLVNAIKHGNKLDKAKNVHIEYKVTPEQCEICIEDQGPGFHRTCVPDPTLEENIEKCSGRGILLMEAYMSIVRWSRGGRRVRMIKKNEPDVPRQ